VILALQKLKFTRLRLSIICAAKRNSFKKTNRALDPYLRNEKAGCVKLVDGNKKRRVIANYYR